MIATRAAALALLITSASTRTSATTCVGLNDRTSPFVQSIKAKSGVSDADFDEFPLEEMLQPLHDELPWLSTCLASIDLDTLWAQVEDSEEYQSCVIKVSTYFAGLDGGSRGASKTGDFLLDSFCPFHRDTVIPCANQVLVKQFNTIVAQSGGCCNALKANIQSSFGSDFDRMLNDLLTLGGDVLCSKKSYKDASGKEVSESCGTAIDRWLQSDSFGEDFTKLIQVPNGEACKALQGQPFKSTNGKTLQMFQGAAPLDACYVPIDALMTKIASYPIIKNVTATKGELDFAALFSSDPQECFKVQSVVDWVQNDGSSIQKLARALDTLKARVVNGDFEEDTSGSSFLAMWTGSQSFADGTDKSGKVQDMIATWNLSDGAAKIDKAKDMIANWNVSDVVANLNISDKNATVALKEMAQALPEDVTSLCFHVPHSFGSCTYKTTVTPQFVKTTTSVSEPTSDARTSTMVMTRVVMMSTLAATVAVLL